MPFLIAAAFVILWFVWANWGRDRADAELGRTLDPVWRRIARRRTCLWQPTGAGGGALREFRCKACNVTAYSASAKGPTECKRGLGGGL